MVHGGGSCSGGGFSGGGFSGGGSGFHFHSTTHYHHSRDRNRRGGETDCTCCALCCAGVVTVVGIAVCCKDQFLYRRLGILWGWITVIIFIASMATSIGTYGPRTREATVSDMIDMNSGLSNEFCTDVIIKSSDSRFDAYILKQNPRFSDKRELYNYTKSTTIPSDKYEYWGYYLLQGSRVRIESDANYEWLDFYIIRGEDNLRKWQKDNYDSSVIIKRVSLFSTSVIHFVATKTAEYYFVYANHGYGAASLSARFALDRVTYDLTDYRQWCSDVKYCTLSLQLGSDDDLVVRVKSSQNTEGDATIDTKCQHRTWIFVVLFFLLPVVIGGFLTFIIYMKFRKNSSHNETNTRCRLLNNDYQKSSLSTYPIGSQPPSYQQATAK